MCVSEIVRKFAAERLSFEPYTPGIRVRSFCPLASLEQCQIRERPLPTGRGALSLPTNQFSPSPYPLSSVSPRSSPSNQHSTLRVPTLAPQHSTCLTQLRPRVFQTRQYPPPTVLCGWVPPQYPLVIPVLILYFGENQGGYRYLPRTCLFPAIY